MTKRTTATKSSQPKTRSFAYLLSQDAELAGLRAEYSQKPALKRRAAAEWTYDESLAVSLFGAAVGPLQKNALPRPKWPPGFAALAIDPEYAPALLTVGRYEYATGRKSEGMTLLLCLARLQPNSPDWVELIDRGADFLMGACDPVSTCRLYEEALRSRPHEQEFIIGMGWALCRASKPVEALPWMEKAIANAPQESSLLSDYGWALTELGRFDEAQSVLQKAVKLAPPDYDLPANNLARLRQLRQDSATSKVASGPP